MVSNASGHTALHNEMLVTFALASRYDARLWERGNAAILPL
jgi:hypothetical protein